MIYNPVYLPSFTLSQIVGTRDKVAPSFFCVEKKTFHAIVHEVELLLE